MSFNMGVGKSGLAAMYSMQLHYLYNSAMYRRWVVDIALSMYAGMQDELVWLDLQKQFRNPDRQQIIPYNLTKEIIDETSILFREEPIYTIRDKKTGKVLKNDMKLWERIRKESRYHNLCQNLDSMTKLLGTVLVKVSFVDPDTGDLVNQNKPGMVQFDLVYGGSYDVTYSASPYYITSVDFGYVDAESAWSGNSPAHVGSAPLSKDLSVALKPGGADRKFTKVAKVKDLDLDSISKVYWSKNSHKVQDEKGNYYEGENPYGCIPAVPFFNQEPNKHYFLPVNEPLIYANHAVNMRLTDLNHVTKHQSFGQAVVKGIERPINNRLGRPIDDLNFRGGSRGSGFGFGSDVGPTGLDRNNFHPFNYYGDGNAQANMNGFSIGPDSIVSVGETGDFKFENPKADIEGITKTIYTMMDMVRINHGLQPKHNSDLPPSGFALMSAKLGVVEQNKKRQILFREREQQLFEVVKKLWNAHWKGEGGADLFTEDSELEIYYVDPEFVVDPQTRVANLKGEIEIINGGNIAAIRKLYPHLDDEAAKALVDKVHKERINQAKRDAEVDAAKINKMKELGLDVVSEKEGRVSGVEINPEGSTKPNTDKKPKDADPVNKVKHSEQSSIQPKKNGDIRETDKSKRAKKQKQLETSSRRK